MTRRRIELNIESIKRDYEIHGSLNALARIYGVSQQTIGSRLDAAGVARFVGRKGKDVIVRFWLSVDTTSNCWMWKGYRESKFGYGAIMMGGKRISAHRASWIINKGKIPDGLQVLHNCDSPGCVRPDHLFLGTQADNMRDMAKKERQANRKLKTDEVLAIRKFYIPYKNSRELADKYGVTQDTIRDITERRTWTHV